jgi:PAS domain S-box-containing protein
VLFSDDRGIGFASRTKWYDISPITQGLLEQRTVTLISDLPEFFCRQGLNESPDRTIKSFLARGFRSMIRYPVFRNGRLVASYSFFNTRPDGFDETHRKIVQALPIDSALITALNYQTTSELGFRFDLLKKLVACHENRRLSGLLVKEIFAYYQWANVSIFDVDTLTDSIVLNNQKAVSKHFQLPAKHRQRLDKGLLGLAYRQGQAVNVGNVEEGVFREHFIKACPLTVSELCIPLRANGRIVALLNIEDHHENAFSPEEVRSLEVLLDEAGAVFERIRRDNVGRAAFQTTPSAVFVIDKLGMVRSANPAASRLLGYSEPLEGKNLGELFQDKALGEAFVAADNAVSKEVILLRADGSPVSVLMGGSLLGAQFEGERVISAKDLQGYIRSEETKFLGQIYYEIATQYKTPLALVFSWLKMLRESESDLVMDVVEKCLRQLNKIELTIDRLALFDKSRPAPSYDPALIDLRELFRNITDDFPLAERKRIKFEWLGETYLIRGDSFQLSFVFKTILSYFIRSSASDQSDITVQCVGGKEEIAICLKGPWAGLIARDHGRRRSDAVLSRILWEMAFGEEAIARFLKNHHAQVEQEELPDTCHRSYTIRFFAAIPEVYQ